VEKRAENAADQMSHLRRFDKLRIRRPASRPQVETPFLATIDAGVIALDAALNTSLQDKARAHAQERSCACRGLRCRCTFGSANH
jgi:hypothetical protein